VGIARTALRSWDVNVNVRWGPHVDGRDVALSRRPTAACAHGFTLLVPAACTQPRTGTPAATARTPRSVGDSAVSTDGSRGARARQASRITLAAAFSVSQPGHERANGGQRGNHAGPRAKGGERAAAPAFPGEGMTRRENGQERPSEGSLFGGGPCFRRSRRRCLSAVVTERTKLRLLLGG
jgi:hypothetical protein